MAATNVSTSTNSLLTDDKAQGNLLREHKRKFASLPDDIRVIQTCTDAGFMKPVSDGQYFVTFHDEEMTNLGCSGLCREHTLPRDDDQSRAKVWIRGDTRMGPALEVVATNHQGHHGVEIKLIPCRVMDLNLGL